MEEMPSFDGSIAVVDCVNKKIRRGDKPATDRKTHSERAELLKAIERGEKMIGQSENVKSLRERLPKHRLHYNSMNDLAAYRENLRLEYKRLNPARRRTHLMERATAALNRTADFLWILFYLLKNVSRGLCGSDRRSDRDQ